MPPEADARRIPHATEPRADARRLGAMLGRRWPALSLAFASAFGASLLWVLSEAPVYRASARVSIAAAPAVLRFGEEFVAEPSSPRSRALEAEIALALSDRVLGMVVDQRPAFPPPEPTLFQRIGLAQAPESPAPEELRQARIELLRRALTLEPLGDGTVLGVSALGPSAGAAAELANAAADAFVDYKANERRDAAQRAVQWLGERSNELRRQIEERERALSELAKHRSLAAAPDGAGGSADSLGAQLERARIELLTVEQQLAGLAPLVVARPTPAQIAEREALRTQLSRSRLELQDVRLRYTPTHPEVERLEGTVRELEARLARTAPAHEGPFVAEFQRLQAQRVLLEARVRVLREALAGVEVDGDAAAQAALDYERQQREIGIDRQLLDILLRRLNETVLSAATGAVAATVLDRAQPPRDPISPDRLRGVALSLALSLAAALSLGLGLGFLDRRVYQPDAAAKLLGAPYLGLIPLARNFDPAERQRPDSLAAESFRNLRTALRFAGGETPLSSLLVTSGVAGEGKTTVSCNLAASFARSGCTVLLVDADLRRPRVDRVFGVEPAPGLAELLRGDAKLEQAIRRVPDLGFDLVPSGEIPENPSELLGSPRFDLVLSKMKSHYDLVLIDSAVMLAVSDPLLLARRVDATLLVCRAGKLERSALERMRTLVERAEARVIGIAFNGIDEGDRYGYPSYLHSPYTSLKRSPRPRGLRALLGRI